MLIRQARLDAPESGRHDRIARPEESTAGWWKLPNAGAIVCMPKEGTIEPGFSGRYDRAGF